MDIPATCYSITTKGEFWDHVYSQLEALLDGQTNWVPFLLYTATGDSCLTNLLLLGHKSCQCIVFDISLLARLPCPFWAFG